MKNVETTGSFVKAGGREAEPGQRQKVYSSIYFTQDRAEEIPAGYLQLCGGGAEENRRNSSHHYNNNSCVRWSPNRPHIYRRIPRYTDVKECTWPPHASFPSPLLKVGERVRQPPMINKGKSTLLSVQEV